jgi:DinB family protein
MQAAQILPQDVQRVIDQLDEADRHADALVANLSDAQFHWQPDGGRRWSVAQCLEHLAVGAEVYLAGMRGAVDRAKEERSVRRGPLAPGFFGRQFANSLEPPVRFRGRAPKAIVPSSTLSRAEILSRFHGSHAALKAMAREAATIDANRATFHNPFLKMVRMKLSSAFQVINAHDRRHLWQAEQVIARPDFPR